MDQMVQVLGSLLILAAFGAAQRGSLTPSSRAYLSLNLAGSAILAVLAAHEQQWGFLLLETCWALVSGWSLAQAVRRQPSAASA
jgi:uncharacterized SAM-binding protein YcdF (DUF218 family)